MKSELADYAIQAECGNPSVKQVHMQLIRKCSSSGLSSEQLLTAPCLKSGIGTCELIFKKIQKNKSMWGIIIITAVYQ